MQFNLFRVKGSISERNSFFQTNSATSTSPTVQKPKSSCPNEENTCNLFETAEWKTVSFGLAKDEEVIKKVSSEVGINPRLLVSLTVPEQLRFFSAEREVYKRYFEPLKLLGTMSQFSLGVTGIKPRTADTIEANLHATSSPYYLGKDFETLLDYETKDTEKEQYERLTDAKNHYYQYLYTALFIKQIQVSWEKSGFPIRSGSGGVYATLFNLGFEKSHPHGAPKLGGASIALGGKLYTYGDIAQLFLESTELTREFPKQ